MAATHEIKALYRQFIRAGRNFPNYNIREYILRRSKEGFQSHAADKDASAVSSLVAQAKEQLEVVRRQSLVYSLYGRKTKSVLELDAQARRKA